MIKFTCLQCGYCCRNLIQKHPYLPGVKGGLFLIPKETKLFPREHIYPNKGWGLKGRARPRPLVIYAYQLDMNRCPHLRGNLCEIYENRPLACRGYPLEGLEPIGKIILDPDCRFIKQHLDKGEIIRQIEAPEELAANGTLRLYLAGALANSEEPSWTFDLTTKKWKRVEYEKLREWVANLLSVET